MADRRQTEPDDSVAYTLRGDVEGKRIATLVRTLLDVLPVDVDVTATGTGRVGVDDLGAAGALSVGRVLQVGGARGRLVECDLWVGVAQSPVVMAAADEKVTRVEVDECVQQYGAVVVAQGPTSPQQVFLIRGQRRRTGPPRSQGGSEGRSHLRVDETTHDAERLRTQQHVFVSAPQRQVRLDPGDEQEEFAWGVGGAVWLSDLDDEL